MAKTLLHNSSNLCGLVLSVLETAPLHGYAISREIENRSSDALSYGEGTLYPALRTLERDGFVESNWDTAVVGAARKVYVITDAGIVELAKIRESWKKYSHSVSQVLRVTSSLKEHTNHA